MCPSFSPKPSNVHHALLGPPTACGRESEDGADGLCRFHATRARVFAAVRHVGEQRQRRTPPPRPDWMDNPSLLPKRPPGARS